MRDDGGPQFLHEVGDTGYSVVMVWFLMSGKRSFGILGSEEKAKLTDSPRDNVFNALFIRIIIGCADMTYSTKSSCILSFHLPSSIFNFAYYKKKGCIPEDL